MGLFDDLIPAEPAGRPPVPVVGRALLDTIAGSESPGYNVMYGGGKFDSFADHPRQPVPITSGPNAGRTSSAAGRYQFLGSTWDEVKKEANLPDFSPESQDAGAWHLANKVYKQKTGRDLESDLTNAKGNPAAIQGIGKVLSGTWTSLPGGIEPNRATSSFAQRFNAPTEVSSQARRVGLFDDLVPSPPPPQGQDAASVGSDATLSSPDTGGRFTDTAGQNFRTAREGEPVNAGAGEAAKRGFMRGATFNFIDELYGLAAAGGLDPKDENVANAIAALARGAYKKVTGDAEGDAAYRAQVSNQRAQDAQIQEQQPGASIAGELGGAVATLPIGGFAARGAGLGARTIAGAKTGGAYGALSGAGEGTDLQSRATGGVVGGAIGGAIGGAATPVVEGAVQGARAIGGPLANTIRGIRDPEGEAARRVTGALQRDIQANGGPPGLTPQEFRTSVNAGGPAALVDLGGETTRGLARSAANTSPEARAGLNRAINDRFESQSERVAGWLNQTFGPSDTGATREALQQAARNANRPAYRQAYTDGDRPLWSPEMQRLVSSPDVVDAMRTAAQRGQSRAVTDGFGGFNSSVQISPTGVVEFTRGRNGQPAYPNLQFWDYTKRALDDAANAARRAGRNDEASVLGQLATTLRNELDRQVPSYQGARAGAARFFGAGDALEAGERFLTGNMPMNDARRAFAAMAPAERDLFREGFVQSLVQRIESQGDRRNVLNAIAQSPRAQQQIELALGPQRAREFEAMMRVEGIMDLARGAVQGNSTTARQLTELGLAGGAYGIGTGLDILNPSPGALASAALVYGAVRGRGAIDQRVARNVGEMLASNDPGVLRRGLQVVSRSQNMMNALRAFDQRIARAGITQAPTVPAIQSGAVGRADEQQK